ncbi:MAG: hypothetical protein CSA22_01630 [Deltaproteobacteria bacterium]|nr:MAG: hypothetical protein CSA22_01630 [Deltaproteobacteria bacterium]
MRSTEQMKAYFEKDRFAAAVGARLITVSPGYAEARLMIREDHFNAVGLVQGGVIFTLADFAFTAAANAHGKAAIALNVNVSFVRPGIRGALTAVARETARSRTIGNYDVTVSDQKGKTVALFHGTVFIRKLNIP